MSVILSALKYLLTSSTTPESGKWCPNCNHSWTNSHQKKSEVRDGRHELHHMANCDGYSLLGKSRNSQFSKDRVWPAQLGLEEFACKVHLMPFIQWVSWGTRRNLITCLPDSCRPGDLLKSLQLEFRHINSNWEWTWSVTGKHLSQNVDICDESIITRESCRAWQQALIWA